MLRWFLIIPVDKLKTKLLKPTLIFITLSIVGISISFGSGSLAGEFEQNLLSNLGFIKCASIALTQ